jgi:hypothetical protein
MVWSFLVVSATVQGQVKNFREYDSRFQISFFPGIGSNGIVSGFYFNKYSLNLFGGVSAGNRILEIGLISNVNLKASTGIQVAGLANIVGANAFINLTQYEERDLLQDGFESNMTGIQLASIVNYVRTHVSGIQIATVNAVGLDFKGAQLAGIGNSAGGHTIGFQLAGLYNVAHESMAGVQISVLFNHTEGMLSGTQFGLVNKAKIIKGKHSMPFTRARGLQIGLVNFSKEMDGLQIGLINFGGAALGTQIGLINFFKKFPTKENVKLNTPIGLLNFGSRGAYSRLYFNELFPANFETSTGNCANCSPHQSEMPYDDVKQKSNQNALIFGYNPFENSWGLGYGFQRLLYNKVTMMLSPLNKKKMIGYGVKFIHLNRSMSFDKTFNLVNRLNIDFGWRKSIGYLYMGLSLNYFLVEPEMKDAYRINSAKIDAGELFGLSSSLWPGYTIGLQF